MNTASHDILEATDPEYAERLEEGGRPHAVYAPVPKRSIAETKALIDRVLGVAPGTPWLIHEAAK